MYFENDTDLYRIICANIKYYIEEAKLTQVQLVEQAKSCISYLSKIEIADCDKSLSISVLNQIANVINVGINKFLRRYPNHETYRSADKNRKTCLYSLQRISVP